MAKKPKRPELTRAKVTLTSHPKAPWRVAYDAEQDGKQVRLRRMFANEDRAWTFAEERDLEIRNHGLRYGDIPAEVRRAFDFYRDQSAELLATGAEVPRFEDLVSRALTDIREQIKRAQERHTSIAEAVEAFTSYMKPRVGKLHHDGIRKHLSRFNKVFGDRSISEIKTREIEEWLASMVNRKSATGELVSSTTRNAHRTALHSLFNYACAPGQGWCQTSPLSGTTYEKTARTEPKAYTVENSASLMLAAVDHHPELIPILALGFFAGLRPCEAEVFDIAKLTPETTEFRVNSTKTGPRIVPFNAACKAWIFSQPRRTGQGWIGKRDKMYDAITELHATASVAKLHDGFRHSYITYRCAEIRDVGKVADECGNSPNTIKKHYREIVTAAAATKYFAIRPPEIAENVTNIEEGRASA